MFYPEPDPLPDDEAIAEFCSGCDHCNDASVHCRLEPLNRECIDAGLTLRGATVRHVRVVLGQCKLAHQDGVEGEMRQNGFFADCVTEGRHYVPPAIRKLFTCRVGRLLSDAELEVESESECLERIAEPNVMQRISATFYKRSSEGEGNICYDDVIVTPSSDQHPPRILRPVGLSYTCITITAQQYAEILQAHAAVEAYRRKMSDA